MTAMAFIPSQRSAVYTVIVIIIYFFILWPYETTRLRKSCKKCTNCAALHPTLAGRHQ